MSGRAGNVAVEAAATALRKTVIDGMLMAVAFGTAVVGTGCSVDKTAAAVCDTSTVLVRDVAAEERN